ncbi:DUF362 domain-containing protein [Ktedonosporobacter rubrisoli]|uniref:DUF362 domain-containing protein n=1 Tax=Ktedonosporobacter rubrisoli TaxID=2509675 RepID=A0A4P6JWC4_KTERU|nr:DUF362 domain-containing protein [Ktedonosporobacter rubrisoli]QBD79765.1 DUF362 domain-containing protein [Ktedonosporobacter rubrisoli]
MLATRTITDTNTVAITRTFDGIEEAAHRVIAQAGGMESVIRGAKIAILKPNLVAGRDASTGSTTSFELMKAVAEEVRACGAEPVLCETPGTEFDREATYTILGIEKFCQENNIRILRVDPEGGEADWMELRPEGARKLRTFHIPQIMKEARLINLPVLKTHVVSGITLSMKNVMGILPRPDRRNMHTFGIGQSIVDMNLGIKPDLNIVDGSVGQDGEGPLYGDKADLQVLVAGRDSLSVDLACCELVGVNPRDIPHLRLALQQMGRPWWQLAGEDVGLIKRFRLPEQKALYRFIFWLMYPLDYPYSWIAERGKHFCTSLYSTGLVGTRPKINEEKCTHCGVCVDACPLPNVIDLTTLKVNPKTCQRCLLCYEACPENAISVKGYSGARQ